MPCCRVSSRLLPRCHRPLIRLCRADRQLRLDLNDCGPCGTAPAALLLQRGGCPEYEERCEIPTVPCGCVTFQWPPVLRRVEKPRPSVVYPLHEIDPEGLAVFVFDDKLWELGPGRYEATVLLLADDEPARRLQDTVYRLSDVRFDVDLVKEAMPLHAIHTARAYHLPEDC